MSVVNPYEVELKISYSQNSAYYDPTKPTEMVTVTEHAYGPLEAVQQAMLNAGYRVGMECKYELVSVGPPKEARSLASSVLDAEMEDWRRRVRDLAASAKKSART